MFPTKCQGQNDRMGCPVISCACQHLDFSIRLPFKSRILPYLPLRVFSRSSIHFTGGMFPVCMIYPTKISNISKKYQIHFTSPKSVQQFLHKLMLEAEYVGSAALFPTLACIQHLINMDQIEFVST